MWRKFGTLAIAAVLVALQRSGARGAQTAAPAAGAGPADGHAGGSAEYRGDAAAGVAKDDSRQFGCDPDDPGPVATDLSPAITAEGGGQGDAQGRGLAACGVAEVVRDDGHACWMAGSGRGACLCGIHAAASNSLGEEVLGMRWPDVGNGYNWGLRTQDPSGDDMSIAQTYLEHYFKDASRRRSQHEGSAGQHPGRPRVELGAASGSSGGGAMRSIMAPPTWARMYAATGDRKYMSMSTRSAQRPRTAL